MISVRFVINNEPTLHPSFHIVWSEVHYITCIILAELWLNEVKCNSCKSAEAWKSFERKVSENKMHSVQLCHNALGTTQSINAVLLLLLTAQGHLQKVLNTSIFNRPLKVYFKRNVHIQRKHSIKTP